MHLGMNIEHDRKIMDCLYQNFVVKKRRYIRKHEIAKNTGLTVSSLKRPLERLERRGWIESKTRDSISGIKPDGGLYHIPSFQEKRKEITKEAKNSWVFSEHVKNFNEEIRKLNPNFDKIHSKEYEKTLNKGRIKNRAKIWKKNTILKPKKITFYSLKEYPYLYRISGGFVRNGEIKKISEWHVPVGKKQFWKKASHSIKKHTKKYETRLKIPTKSID